MSATRFLLLFLDAEGGNIAGWLRVAEGSVVARGRDVTAIPPADPQAIEHLVLVVPGTEMVVHWIDLPALAPAQARAAARLLAADVSASPPDRLHVALGRSEAGLRAMALAEAASVARWLGVAQAAGFDPDHLVPEPLLILPPDEGVRRWERDGVQMLRGEALALAAEPEIAALVHDRTAVEPIDDAAFEAGVGEALAEMPLDLRQGPFGRKRHWRIDWALTRRLALIGLGILVATLMIQAVLIARYSFAADRLDREADAIARSALPRGERVANAPAQLAERLAALRGGGLGFSDSAALAFAVVRDTPDIELGALRFERDGSLRLTVMANDAAGLEAFRRALETRGLAVTADPARSGGGRRIAEMVARPR